MSVWMVSLERARGHGVCGATEKGRYYAIWPKVSQGRRGGDNVYTCDLDRSRALADIHEDSPNSRSAVLALLINTE